MQPDEDFTSTVPGMDRWGWMSPDELLWLNAEASTMAGGVVEIGCLHGRSSVALAVDCPGLVWCIDPWSDDGWRSWSEGVGAVYPNVRGIRAASPEASALVPTPVDMVFIDGAHDYASVRADIECWWPLTNRLICGHDYVRDDGDLPGVVQAVDEFFAGEEYEVLVAPETAIWYVRKA